MPYTMGLMLRGHHNKCPKNFIVECKYCNEKMQCVLEVQSLLLNKPEFYGAFTTLDRLFHSSFSLP